MYKIPLSFPALTYRNFRLFWFGQLISLTGTWMHSAAQGWLVLKLTDSPFYLGLVGMAGSIPILLFTLVGGVAADRFHKRNIILSMQGILMLLAFTLAFLVTTGTVTIWHVLAIAFLIGTAHAFDIPARQSFFIEPGRQKEPPERYRAKLCGLSRGKDDRPCHSGGSNRLLWDHRLLLHKRTQFY